MNSDNKPAKEECRLCAHQGLDEWCTRESCIFWRMLEVQDEDLSNIKGCGLQFFDIIDSLNPDTAEWLLKMKKRLENTQPAVEKARINFRRREY